MCNDNCFYLKYDWMLHIIIAEDLTNMLQVLRRVEELEQRASALPADVVVVGAGYAGVELASTVAERLGSRANVQLVSAGQSAP